MAHTLNIHDGVEGTTLSLAATTATGYHLISYPYATQPAIDDRRTSSLYSDGDLPYYDRRVNITEEITLEIVGSSRDDLFIKLRALQRAMENARDYFRYVGVRQCTYLEFLPTGCTNTSYSILMAGSVDASSLIASMDDSDTESGLLSNTISNVKLTIEREPFWRDKAPVLSSTVTDWATVAINGTNVVPHTKFTTAAIPGDMPALVRLEFQTTALSKDELVVGSTSAKRHGANYDQYGYIDDASNPGTNTAIQDDGSAVGDPDNDATTESYRVSFANTTSERRIDYLIGFKKHGTFRVYLRALLTSASTATAYIRAVSNRNSATLPSVSIAPLAAGAVYGYYYLGVVTNGIGGTTLMETVADALGVLNTIEVYIAGVGGMTLDLDGLLMVPVDEYYIECKLGTNITRGTNIVYDNILPTPHNHYIAVASVGMIVDDSGGKGKLMLEPGVNSLTVLWQLDGRTFSTGSSLYLYYVARYSAPRGNG